MGIYVILNIIIIYLFIVKWYTHTTDSKPYGIEERIHGNLKCPDFAYNIYK